MLGRAPGPYARRAILIMMVIILIIHCYRILLLSLFISRHEGMPVRDLTWIWAGWFSVPQVSRSPPAYLVLD